MKTPSDVLKKALNSCNVCDAQITTPNEGGYCDSCKPDTETAACHICLKAGHSPWRSYDAEGRIVNGCIDDFHTGKLVAISESNRWHNRPSARSFRKLLKKGVL